MSTDPCPSCGAAMAADQRYCLACGERRAEARLDYLEILRGATPAVAGTAAPAVTDVRQRVNTTVIASIGCLLLAMGVGVLIGNSGNGADQAAAPAAAAPQVIKVEGGGAATESASATPKAAKKSPAKAKKKSSADTESAATAADSKATNPALTDLENTSGDDYAKEAGKLPKTLSTGGKPPPIDKSKPAGGGSDFEDIG